MTKRRTLQESMLTGLTTCCFPTNIMAKKDFFVNMKREELQLALSHCSTLSRGLPLFN